MGADAPAFELVSSAAAAEHVATLPSPAGVEPPLDLPQATAISVETYDPNVSADDLLGAPVYAEALDPTIELAALLEALHQPQALELRLMLQPAVSEAPWWR
jgi:hypothetical protein